METEEGRCFRGGRCRIAVVLRCPCRQSAGMETALTTSSSDWYLPQLTTTCLHNSSSYSRAFAMLIAAKVFPQCDKGPGSILCSNSSPMSTMLVLDFVLPSTDISRVRSPRPARCWAYVFLPLPPCKILSLTRPILSTPD